jgi:hypothetical protein
MKTKQGRKPITATRHSNTTPELAPVKLTTTNDAAFWAENSRVQREVFAEIVARKATTIAVDPEEAPKTRMYKIGFSYRGFRRALLKRKRMAAKGLPYNSRILNQINGTTAVSR